jgi:hypothetical protein
MVATLADKHVDMIKIVIDDRRGTAVKLPREVAIAVIDEAHKRHLKVFAHIHDYDDAKFLVSPGNEQQGVDMLTHEVRELAWQLSITKWPAKLACSREYSAVPVRSSAVPRLRTG